MKKTPKNILNNARQLFNTYGVNNIRLQDIADKSGISGGNLSYHFKTKKQLIKALLSSLQLSSFELRTEAIGYLAEEDYFSIIKGYLRFRIEHRYFFRDILDLRSLLPEAKKMYATQMNQVITFTKNGIYLAVGKGLWKPEPHDGNFHYFAKNIWAIFNSWLIEREVFGEEELGMEQIITALWEFHHPYFTTKGLEHFKRLKSQIPEIVREEMTTEKASS